MFLFTETPVDKRATSIRVMSGDELPENLSTKYSFVVITDSHFIAEGKSHRDDAFLEKFKSLLASDDEAMRPRFIVNLGDTLDSGRESGAAEFNAQVSRWQEAAKSALGVSSYKVYSVLGNHDLYNDGWEVWKEKIWPYTSYYKMNPAGSSGFSFYFLDTGNGTLGAPQFENLLSNLKSDPCPKLVFCHYPLYADGIFYFMMDDTIERNRLLANFAKNNVRYIFEGHYHHYRTFDYGKFKEVLVPSFLFEYSFALLTVDENSKSVSYQIIEY